MSRGVMADAAGIKEGDKVLDAGCGVGGSSIWLAELRGCSVTGISLNANQVKKATEYAREAGLSDRVQFEQKDYCHTGYAGNSFDVIWAIESVCYANDKTAFIREASRLLKKGGRLIVADFFKAGNLEGKDAEDVQKLAHGWAVNDFATEEDFRRQLTAAGYQNIQVQDIGEAILPSVKRLYRSYFIGKPIAVLYGLFNRKTSSLSKGNVETAWYQYHTFKKGLWKYLIFVGEKD